MKELYIKINFLFCCLLFLRKAINNDKTIPDVSIIISIFNSEKYLISCLNSIIYQSLKNIEIICINDGSKDESLNILKEYQKKDQRIIIISQNNEGAGIARNKGIMKSRGKYLGFVDSDDMLPDNFTLEILYNKSIHNRALIFYL
jgi:glycosyltransferase involved in cell wall biosynthesis